MEPELALSEGLCLSELRFPCHFCAEVSSDGQGVVHTASVLVPNN